MARYLTFVAAGILSAAVISCSKKDASPDKPSGSPFLSVAPGSSPGNYGQTGIGSSPAVYKPPFSARYIRKLASTRLFKHCYILSRPSIPGYPKTTVFADTFVTIKVLSDTTIEFLGKTLYFSMAMPPFYVDTSSLVTFGYGNLYDEKFELRYHFGKDSIYYVHEDHIGAGGSSSDIFESP